MTTPAPGRTLGDYLDVLIRHRWLLIAVTLLGLLAGTGYSTLSPRQYESQTSVLVQPTGAEEGALAQGRTKTEINLDTEAQLVKSTEVATLAAERLGETTLPPADLARQVTVTVPPNTSILTIGFVADGPHRAQAGAEAFGWAYLHHRANSAHSRLSEQAAAMEEELATLRDERDELSGQLDDLNSGSSRYAAVKNDRDILDDEIADLTADYSQLRTAAESVGSGKVISEAAVPTTAASPHHLVGIAGGTTVGLLLALCIVAIRMRFAVRVWHAGDVARRCDVEVLATLPNRPEAKATDVFGAFGPGGRVFGKLRNEVVAALGEPPQVIVVAGVAPGSASSVVTANLAAALARSGDATVAVATHPGGGPTTVVSLLGTPAVPGLSDVFAERVALPKVLHRAARQPALTVIGPGGCANAAGPSRDTVAEVYERLREHVSYVVVDAAPMAVSSDAQLLATGADAVLLTIECGRDRIDEVVEAAQAVRRIGASMLGAVVLPRNTMPKTPPLEVPQREHRAALTRRPAPRPRFRDDASETAPENMPSPDDTPTDTMPVVEEDGTPQTSTAPGGPVGS